MDFRVSKKSKVGKVAEAIRNEMEKNKEVKVNCIGKEAGWIALKAIAIAGKGVFPEFVKKEVNGEGIVVLEMEVVEK